MSTGLPSLADADGRRFWAFIAILGGCIVFTIFAAVGVWLVSGNAYYSLILALAAHLQLFVGMGAFSFVLGRRMAVEGGPKGFKYRDSEAPEPETPAEGAALATAAAADVTHALEKKE